jgi:Lrp/AsnC family transcriptional regulator, leucine-responsive regulatory protein
MDATDHRILKALVRNGRATFAALGAEVGLSPHGAADRVRRLERAGVIQGYAARVDLERLGRRLDAMVDVRLAAATDPDAFEAAAVALPAVRELAFVTGRFDYQLRLACEDADELDQVVRALRRAGAVQTETKIVMRTIRGDVG